VSIQTKNLQKASFKNEDLSNSGFSGSDLRGADFSGSNLRGADFTNARTGITSTTVILLFFGALTISLLSGYIAMLAGRTIQVMMASKDSNVKSRGNYSALVSFCFYHIFLPERREQCN
jgi:hypothetical protein